MGGFTRGLRAALIVTRKKDSCLHSIDDIVKQLKRDRPDAIWLEESAHSVQKVGSRKGLALLEEYFSSLRHVHRGPIIWRGLIPFKPMCCEGSLEAEYVYYLLGTLPRMARRPSVSLALDPISTSHAIHDLAVLLSCPAKTHFCLVLMHMKLLLACRRETRKATRRWLLS